MKRLKALVRDRSGNALAIGAAAMPLLIGGAGLAIDTVQISLAKRELQRAADSAAMAGAYAINQNPTSTGTARTDFAKNAATRDLQLNNDVATTGTPIVQNAPATGAFAGNTNAVRVQLTASRSLSFLSFFDATPAAITVEATAAIVREGDFCMLSLEDSAVAGITMTGNATLNLGCGMSTNSRAPAAITATGSSSVRASPIMAVGGVPASANLGNSTRIPFAPVQADPFAYLPAPTPSGCTAPPRIQPNDEIKIDSTTPGWNSTEGSICFNGLDVNGKLNFPSGAIVYVNGGTLSFGAQAQVTGSNVTFVLTSTSSDATTIARLDLNGTAQINISAPTSGPYANVAFYQDRRAPNDRTVTFNGNAATTINGAMYFPSSAFDYSGNAQTTATCLQLVARRLNFTGNGTVRNDCSGTPGRTNFQATWVRLVA